MLSKRIFVYCLLSCIYLSSVLFAASSLEQQRCSIVLTKYGIHSELKSNSGWARVCNNDKLNLYTENPLTDSDKEIICKCVITLDKDRSIEKFKDSNNE